MSGPGCSRCVCRSCRGRHAVLRCLRWRRSLMHRAPRTADCAMLSHASADVGAADGLGTACTYAELPRIAVVPSNSVPRACPFRTSRRQSRAEISERPTDPGLLTSVPAPRTRAIGHRRHAELPNLVRAAPRLQCRQTAHAYPGPQPAYQYCVKSGWTPSRVRSSATTDAVSENCASACTSSRRACQC